MVSVIEDFYDYCGLTYPANSTKNSLNPMDIPTDTECIQ